MQHAITDLFSALGVQATIGNDSLVPAPMSYTAMPSPKLLMNAETWERYHPQLAIKGARRHPVTLVESAALAAVRAPLPKVRPVLEPALFARGILSNEQAEAIVYACQAFEGTVHGSYAVTLPPVEGAAPDSPESKKRHFVIPLALRGGMMIADGMGSGKTRSGLGIIRAQMHAGRAAHVWCSLKSSLVDGVVSGWTELLGDRADVTTWKNDAPHTSGIRFLSYAALVRRGLDRFIATLGPADEYGICRSFEGVLVLDEAHAGMNADPVGGEFDLSRSASKRGQLIVEMQLRLPNARVLYLTGTNAERADALAYAVRLGHIGPHASFKTNREFTKQINQSGTVAAEVVCQSLKAQGRLMSRTLSFEGVEYDRRVVIPDAQQIDAYNNMAAVFRALDHGLAEECLRLGAAKPPAPGSKRIMSVKHSPMRTFVGQLSSLRSELGRQALNAIMLPQILGGIQELLESGYSVVMQIDRTGEAALVRALAEVDQNDAHALETLDVTHRAVMRGLIAKHYPIHRYQIVLDSNKVECAILMKDGKGDVIVDQQAVRNRDRYLEMIDQALLPDLGHDLVREHFGELVGEITGRSYCIVREDRGDGVKRRYVVKRSAKDNERDLADFRVGKKRVLIISDAGGTGLDLHASTLWPNQERRAHIIADIGPSATNESQKFARTHRTGQVSQPLYVLYVTNLPAHKRLLSTPTRKLAQLGALSRGQRDAVGGGIFSANDNLETRYGRDALAQLLRDIKAGTCEIGRDEMWDELTIDVGEATVVESGIEKMKAGGFGVTVKSFLTKLMSASIDENGGFQQRVLGAFQERLDQLIEQAMEAGRYDGGLQTWKPASAVVIACERLSMQNEGSSDLLTVRIGELPEHRSSSAEVSRSYAEAEAAYRHQPPQFYDTPSGVALVREAYGAWISITTPRGFRTDAPSAVNGWTPIDVDAALARWAIEYAALPVHYTTHHIATGDIISIWNSLGTSLNVVRFTADDQTAVIGRVIRPDEVEMVRTNFGLAAAA